MEDAKLPLVAWFGLLVGAAMVLVSLTGLLGHLSPGTVSLALVAAALAAVAGRRAFEARFDPRSPVLLLWPLLALSAVAAWVPPHSWDEVAYGAALPRDYARAGRFFYNADYGVISAFPANFEALTTASIVLTHGVVPAQLLTVAFAFGLAAAAFHLGRRLGVRTGPALVAGVFVLTAPGLMAIASVVKNDVANAFFQVLFLVVLVHLAQRPRIVPAVMAGFFLGIAIGIKYSSLQFAFCALPAVAIVLLGPPRRWREWAPAAALFAVTGAAFALPWYLRTYRLLGNPLYPFYSRAFPAANGFDADHALMFEQMTNMVRGFNWATGTVGDFVRSVGVEFGAVAMALALPGLVLSLRSSQRRAALPLVIVFVLYGLVTLRAGFWLPRYFLSLLVVGCVLAAVALDAMLATARRYRWGALALAGAVLAACLATSDAVQDQLAWKWLVVHDWFTMDRERFLVRHVRFWQVAQWLNENAREGDRIGVGMNAQPFYYLERSYFHIHPTSEKGHLLEARTPDDFLRAFRALGLTMLAVRRWDPQGEIGAAAVPGAAPRLDAFLDRFYEAIHVLHEQKKIRRQTMILDMRVYRIEAEPEKDAESGAPKP